MLHKLTQNPDGSLPPIHTYLSLQLEIRNVFIFKTTSKLKTPAVFHEQISDRAVRMTVSKDGRIFTALA